MTRILLLALTLSSQLAFADGPAAPGAGFAVPHRRVDIGGRKLNLYCSGSGSPTVVFDSPSGSAGWVWWAVQPPVAARTRACVHDRAGFGFSDPTPRPADAQNAVDDLHALLKAAGIAPPYVLVGNSSGGGNMELFAWRHPDEVAGLVLVEPMHEDENLRAEAATHGAFGRIEAEMFALRTACADQADKGFVAGSEMFEQCIGGVDPSLPGVLGEVDLRQRMSPAYWHAAKAEQDAFEASRSQLRAARKPFGDLPLVVLARGVSPYLIPHQPQSEANKALEAANLALQTAVARSSSQGDVRVVANASHMIQETHPDAVVTAVDDVLDRVRR